MKIMPRIKTTVEAQSINDLVDDIWRIVARRTVNLKGFYVWHFNGDLADKDEHELFMSLAFPREPRHAKISCVTGKLPDTNITVLYARKMPESQPKSTRQNGRNT